MKYTKELREKLYEEAKLKYPVGCTVLNIAGNVRTPVVIESHTLSYPEDLWNREEPQIWIYGKDVHVMVYRGGDRPIWAEVIKPTNIYEIY